MNWHDDPHTCWTISVTVSNAHLKNFNPIRIHDLCAAGAVALPPELWSHSDLRRSIHGLMCSCERNVYEVWLRDELRRWSSQLLQNLSYCLICAHMIIQELFLYLKWMNEFGHGILVLLYQQWETPEQDLNPDLCHGSAGLLKIHSCVILIGAWQGAWQ